MKNLKINPVIILVIGVTSLYAFSSVSNYKEGFFSNYVNQNGKDSIDFFYEQVMDVVSHKRCVNCHTNSDIPNQGEDSHPHYFEIQRGKKNKGFEALKCATCHQSENNSFSGVPGAPHWSVPPLSMKWEGLSREEIATSMMDKSRNGNRDKEEIFKHMTEDSLVLWAWNPGVNADGVEREKPPVDFESFKYALRRWIDEGAVIPN